MLCWNTLFSLPKVPQKHETNNIDELADPIKFLHLFDMRVVFHTSTFFWSKNPEGDACDGRREDPVQWRFEWLCEQRSSAQNLDSAAGDEIFLWLWTQHFESPSGFLYDFEHLCKATMSKFTESHGLQVIESPGFPSLSHSWSSCGHGMPWINSHSQRFWWSDWPSIRNWQWNWLCNFFQHILTPRAIKSYLEPTIRLKCPFSWHRLILNNFRHISLMFTCWVSMDIWYIP